MGCKYAGFDADGRDMCFYFQEKVKETVPLHECAEETCPIIHPEMLTKFNCVND